MAGVARQFVRHDLQLTAIWLPQQQKYVTEMTEVVQWW
jgi:hypothetical protein